MTNDTLKEAYEAYRKKTAIIIDVRTEFERNSQYVPDTDWIPLYKFLAMDLSEYKKGKALYLLCQSGERSKQANKHCVKNGINNAIVIEGGVNAWKAADFPLLEPGKVISLERQVRISAGSLVLVGVLLGQFVHPCFFIISGIVGVGLVFAGVTGTCGMA
jgi:rhodanese-related sulfurtransferase